MSGGLLKVGSVFGVLAIADGSLVMGALSILAIATGGIGLLLRQWQVIRCPPKVDFARRPTAPSSEPSFDFANGS
jgi:hypothetical protein